MPTNTASAVLHVWAERHVDAIRGRLAAERARNDSDAELDRCLSPCVGGNRLVPAAQLLRDAGVALVGPLEEIEAYVQPEVCDYFKAKDFVGAATPHTLSLLVVDGLTEDVRSLASRRLSDILRDKPELNAMLTERAALALAESRNQ